MAGKITIKRKKTGFTNILNEPFQRNDLSWKAKGLLAYLLTCSEEWTIYKKDLKNRAKDGYDSMLSAFIELEKEGYIETKVNRTAGMFDDIEYLVHESPIRDFPESVFPDSVFPELINNSLKKNINTIGGESFEEREMTFKKSLNLFWKCSSNPEGYSKEMLEAFAMYWTEPSSGKIKKMRFELEKTWDTKRRLMTWKTNDDNRPKKNTPYKPSNSFFDTSNVSN